SAPFGTPLSAGVKGGMKRRAVRFLAAGFFLAFGAFASAGESHGKPANIESARIPLYPAHPDQRRAGMLVYRGGLVLRSAAREFGGWSDIAVNSDGSQILAISDGAHWLRAQLIYDANGDLAGTNSGEIAPMLDMQGHPMRGKEGDAEGLALEHPGDLYGTVAVSFERDVRVWRYDLSHGLDAKPTNVRIGHWVDALHDNKQ